MTLKLKNGITIDVGEGINVDISEDGKKVSLKVAPLAPVDRWYPVWQNTYPITITPNTYPTYPNPWVITCGTITTGQSISGGGQSISGGGQSISGGVDGCGGTATCISPMNRVTYTS